MTTTRPERDAAEKPQRPKRCKSCAHYDADRGTCAKVLEGISAVCTSAVPPAVHRVKLSVSHTFGCIYWEK